MRRRSGSGAEDFRIELTSLVDIIFLLILFLVLTTTFTVNQGMFKVNLPKAVTSVSKPAQSNKVLTILVTKNNAVYVNNTDVGLKGLANFMGTYVAQYGTPTAVYHKAEQRDEYGTIIDVMDVLRVKKVFNIDLIVKRLQ